MAACITPFQIKHEGQPMYVPCGKCPPCLMRRASGWSFRLMQEDKVALSSWFITLTYDTQFVPITSNKYMSLRKRDLQLFFKKLRYFHTGHSYYNVPIKYFAVGEYGSKRRRPHYHLLLFNADVNLVERAWTDEGRSIGDAYYGSVTSLSVGYCLKYMMKMPSKMLHKMMIVYESFNACLKDLARVI